MNNENKSINRVLYVVSVLPIFITVIALFFLPDRIPAHYNGSGDIDRWGSKYETFIVPLYSMAMLLFFKGIIYGMQHTKVDEKKKAENITNVKVTYYLAVGTQMLTILLNVIFILMSFSNTSDSAKSVDFDICAIETFVLGIFMIFIGNYLPKCKRNSIIGIRTYWSKKSDDIWRKTQQIGGINYIIVGIIIIIGSAFYKDLNAIFFMTGVVFADTILLVFISWYIYHKEDVKEIN